MNHSFDIEIAEKYGVIEAVLYENFRHWLRHNYANGKNMRDGKPWTFNSVRAYADLFPYLSEKQIRRGIDSLVEQGALVKGEYNKANYDKTSWYSVPDIAVLAIRPNGQMDSPKKANRSARTGEPIPDINTDKKQDIAAAACMPNTSFGKETKTKVKKTIDLSPIEPVLKILRESDKNADKSISYNLRNLIKNEIELNGEDFVCAAVRGRMAQVKATGKPLYLSTFFDPDRAEWRAECARVGEAMQNAPQSHAGGFKSTLPDFSHIKYDESPIDEEAWQTLTSSKN